MTGAIGTSQEPGASATQPFDYFEPVEDGLVCLPEGAAPVYWWLDRQGVSADFTALYRTEEVFGLWPSRRDITQTWTFGLEVEFGAANREWIASALHARGNRGLRNRDAATYPGRLRHGRLNLIRH